MRNHCFPIRIMLLCMQNRLFQAAAWLVLIK